MSVLRLPPLLVSASRPSTTRSRNEGAESVMPTLANAMPPDLRKNLRFIFSPLLPLKLWRAQNQSDDLRQRIRPVQLFHQRLSRRRGEFSGKDRFDCLIDHLVFVRARTRDFRQIDFRALHTVRRQRESEVHSFEQSAGVHPRLGSVGITVWSLKTVKRFAHARDPLVRSRPAVRVGAKSPNRA